MEKGIARYLFELGQLKRVRRSGWWVAGVDQPESVADFRHIRALARSEPAVELVEISVARAVAVNLLHHVQITRGLWHKSGF